MLPYDVQQEQIKSSQTWPVQYRFACALQLQQSLATKQNLSRIPASTTVVSSVGDPMLYSPTPETTSDSHQASSNLFSNAMKTSSVGCLIPGYVNAYDYGNGNSSVLVRSTPGTMPFVMETFVVPPFLCVILITTPFAPTFLIICPAVSTQLQYHQFFLSVRGLIHMFIIIWRRVNLWRDQ